MYISIHIPKTAGTTFRELLADHFGEGLCLFYGGLKDSQMRPLLRFPEKICCLHGHMHGRDFAQQFPTASRITWVRDPIQRVVSEYEHYIRSPDPRNPLSVLVSKGCSLLEFAEQPAARNTQARSLQGLSASELEFAGISEHFDRELDRFAAVTGISLARGHRSNVNPSKRLSEYDLSSKVRKAIDQLNEDDRELYAEALELAGFAPAPRRWIEKIDARTWIRQALAHSIVDRSPAIYI